MLEPLERLTADPYWALVPLALISWAAVRAQYRIARQHLVNEVTLRPIADLQKAGSAVAIRRLITAWGAEGRCHARRMLSWDFLFLAAYGIGLALLCTLGATNLRRMDAPNAAWVWVAGSWIALVAAVLDAVENLLLWRMLGGAFEGNLLPRSMFLVSKAKWLAVVAVAIFLALPAFLFDLFGCRFGC